MEHHLFVCWGLLEKTHNHMKEQVFSSALTLSAPGASPRRRKMSLPRSADASAASASCREMLLAPASWKTESG